MTTSTPTITLSEAIRTARKRAKMEQAELAGAIGVHEKTLGRWERDATKQPPFAAVVRIALVTGQPLELFTSSITTQSGGPTSRYIGSAAMPGQQRFTLHAGRSERPPLARAA
jgi:transcriptional regulator with XRE-family HTH domain